MLQMVQREQLQCISVQQPGFDVHVFRREKCWAEAVMRLGRWKYFRVISFIWRSLVLVISCLAVCYSAVLIGRKQVVHTPYTRATPANAPDPDMHRVRGLQKEAVWKPLCWNGWLLCLGFVVSSNPTRWTWIIALKQISVNILHESGPPSHRHG
jgi:hypothetical protein